MISGVRGAKSVAHVLTSAWKNNPKKRACFDVKPTLHSGAAALVHDNVWSRAGSWGLQLLVVMTEWGGGSAQCARHFLTVPLVHMCSTQSLSGPSRLFLLHSNSVMLNLSSQLTVLSSCVRASTLCCPLPLSECSSAPSHLPAAFSSLRSTSQVL